MSLKNFLRCLTVLICLKLVAMTDVKSWTNFDQSGRLDKILPSEKMSDLQNWQNFERSGNSSSALSRKRRFIFPAVTPWLFDIRVTMDIPLQGLDTALRAYIPFTWNLNTLVWDLMQFLTHVQIKHCKTYEKTRHWKRMWIQDIWNAFAIKH